jgi:predicted RNA-binding protein YlxR (DUF448 family)
VVSALPEEWDRSHRHRVRLTEADGIDSSVVQRSGPAPSHASAPATGPVRTCVGCRNRALAGELLRVVITDEELALDLRRSLPGRGAWLHPDLGCLSKAERRRAFAKALRKPGELNAGRLRAQLEAMVHRTTGTGSSRAGLDDESRSTRHESAVKLKP